jgi:2-hydroxychromene-2-carboxylate isomerase
MGDEPVFFYDFSSPYAYLASQRIEDLIPGARWQPIMFGALLRQIGKRPWSLSPGREVRMREIEALAAQRGLPPVVWPQGWPAETYSVNAPRAAALAADAGRLHEFTHAAFHSVFVDARPLNELKALLDVCERAGLDRDEAAAGIERDEIKERVRGDTEAAVKRGITGIPTVDVNGELFWGDDRLEEAATAASG